MTSTSIFAGDLTPAQAARQITEEIRPLPVECIPLLEALDRVLASDVRSPMDVPMWDNSAMDGYAVRSADFAAAGGAAEAAGAAVQLRVVETVPAGKFPQQALGPGECTRIFTGAPLPEGADGVIRQEDATPLGADRVRIDKTRDVGKNLRRRGEDIQKESLVLARGTPLGAAHLGVLASIGESEVFVHRRPRVAFFGSGDEIAELDEREQILRGKKIASSNTYTVQAMIRRAGADPINLGIAPDDREEIRQRAKAGFTSDLLTTSAGVSAGEHDYVRQVLDEVKATLKFWKVRMRPGAPVGFGVIGALPWIGLPGNPVSTMVTFELFVRPAIRKMLGHTTLFRRTVQVTAAEPIKLGPPLRHFLRAVVTEDADGSRAAKLTGPQGSGILTSMAKANALLIVPEDQSEVKPGETLTAMLLDDPVHTPEPTF
ncbi:MAG: molybdopterin molybdotransferase MoeA [Gemmatimonadetes bacterium]|nr:molybdopterin molybdotransferase MoeA [Gemmatimonadota bacterium]